jgi:hypothetical protein
MAAWASSVTRRARRAGVPRMLAGFVVTLVIAVPTLVLEEDWHGRPMIDQPGHLWVVPTIVAAAAFALGGLIGTRGQIELWRALWYGLLIGAAAAGVLLLADVARRALRDQAVSVPVLRLWVEASLLSVVMSSLGGAVSYLLATKRH